MDDLDFDHTYGAASGSSRESCFGLAYRFPAGEGFRPERGESWVVEYDGDSFEAHMGKAGWLTGLWRSNEGHVFVTDADGFAYRGPPAPGANWSHERLEGILTGVWGLDDRHVYAWGEQSGSRPSFYAFDGTGWRAAPAPERPIVALHGSAPDLLFAVGDAGFIARWDGTRWTTMPSPDVANLSTVFVVGPDEVYAGGHGRSLHVGSVHRWTRALVHSGPITSIVKWRNEVWVATLGELGLCKLRGNVLESIKPNLQVLRLDHRERLVYTTTAKIGDTPDGQSFASFPVDDFIDQVQDLEPMWE